MTGHHTARCLANIGNMLYAYAFTQLALLFVPLTWRAILNMLSAAALSLYIYCAIKHAIDCDTADAVAKKLLDTHQR